MGSSRRRRRRKTVSLSRVDWLFWMTPFFVIIPLGVIVWFGLSMGLPKLKQLIELVAKLVVVS